MPNEDKPATLKKLLTATAADDNYHDLIRAIQLKKRYKDLRKDHPGWDFKEKWDHLSAQIVGNTYIVMLDEHRIVIPGAYRQEILHQLHDDSHLTTAKMIAFAENRYYWPSMNTIYSKVSLNYNNNTI